MKEQIDTSVNIACGMVSQQVQMKGDKMRDPYQDIIENKIVLAKDSGINITDSEISSVCFPHQRDIIKWAATGGRRAIFASFGLGKTLIQIELMRLIKKQKGGKCLIVCPLGVKQEFVEDGKTLLGVDIEYVRNDDEVQECKAPIMITNYERVRDGKIQPAQFTAVTLDEASILRGYGTKTYQEFLTMFPDVEYRFVCTATPSPNRYKELIHYAGFLGVMDTGQALTRFFQRDSTKANNLTLYKAREHEFWAWLSSWAVFVTKPSDLGYSDDGYALPKLHVHKHMIRMEEKMHIDKRDGQVEMFRDAAMSLQDASREKRDSMSERVDKVIEILANVPDEHALIWHDLEDERRAIKSALPESVDVYGSQDLDLREKHVYDFSHGKIKYLSSKPVLLGSGCNFQRFCNTAIFMGIGYKFNDFIQAVHRIHRFLQNKDVHIHIIYTDKEEQVLRILMEKWKNHNDMVEKMTDIIKEHGLAKQAMSTELKRTLGVDRSEKKGKLYRAIRNDCVIETREMETESVDLICTSIPFGNHYEYSASYEDFGHNVNNDAFFTQMDHLTPELLRVLRPGRVAAIHVKDRIMFGNVTGYGMPSVDAFHADTIIHYKRHGFVFFGMITIETDVVRENNQTYRLGWTEQCKDGSKMGVGCPEYLLLFRKLPSDTGKAYADCKVVKSKQDYTRGQWQIDARAKWNSSGNRLLTSEDMKSMPIDNIGEMFKSFYRDHIYSYSDHVDAANMLDDAGRLPATFEMLKVPSRNEDYVWSDVNRMVTLNSQQTARAQQNHICPLQLDIIERVINRYTNKGEVVYDPFGGIMSTPYMAVKMGRYGIGCELNRNYWRDGIHYLNAAEMEVDAPTLFDMENL
jgi:DNA modification methylase